MTRVSCDSTVYINSIPTRTKIMDDNRKKALAQALGQIEKQFGKGSVMRMGDGTSIRDIEVISTGSIGLDVALGIGGLPKGRVVELSRAPSAIRRCPMRHRDQCRPDIADRTVPIA